MSNFLRYIFGMLGIIAIGGLVFMDKVYTTGQPVPERVYYIVGMFILGCLVGADNLTSLVTSFIKRFIGDGK